MSSESTRVLFYDDEERFRREFVERHRDEFEIETSGDIAGLLADLRERKRDELPDLLMLDLYHDIDPSAPGHAALVDAGNRALADLNQAIDAAKLAVDRAWRPVGVEVAEEVRSHFPRHVLPIMIYSQRGLLLLDDEQMQRIESAEVDWLLKDSERFSAATEAIRIRHVIAGSRAANRLPRDIRIAIWSVVAGVAGSLLTLAVQALVS